jgi:DNA gyrase subunit A
MSNDAKSQPLNIEDEMRSSFLDYAMSVIISRALPDVRDGLKPVHRRILFGMHQLRNTWQQSYKKSARVVGDVIGKFHPHGDAAVYDALVRLAQDFSMRYPLVDGQGNFGSIDGDAPAAMRYTEVRMSRLTGELLADLDKETVDFVPNYDGNEMEPSVMPTKLPNLLLNGAVGIAVGMATNIPPHNLTEILDAALALVEDPRLPDDRLLSMVRGPDFPTRGLILGRAGIRSAYMTGRGSITVRARCEVETDDKGREAIVVTEIPYQVNKTRLIERIAELVREKKIEGISDIQDYSDRTGMRIWIQVKRDADAHVLLNQLYKSSDLQTSFSINMIAIVDGRPQVVTLRDCLLHFLDHRRRTITRRCRYDLDKALARRELVEGLGVAIDTIDRIIELIRKSRDGDEAKAALMAVELDGYAKFLERCGRPAAEIERAAQGPYRLSERQAKAILDMRLQRLTGLEREKIEAEFKELCAEIEELQAILTSTERLDAVVRGELVAIRDEYGDGASGSGTGAPGDKRSRRTEIVDLEHEIEDIDLVADESMVVMSTHLGYVKRIPLSDYKVQARGGVGVNAGANRDDDDFVVDMFEASAKASVLIFTDTGRVFRSRVFELPLVLRNNRPRAWANFLDLKDGERVLKMVPYREEEIDDQHFVLLCSKQGYIKRTSLAEFANIRSSGIIAATIEDGDALVGAHLTDGRSHVILASKQGMAIRFDEGDVRPMGRTARGVKGMTLDDGDEVVSQIVLAPDAAVSLLTICANGYGKRTPAGEYRVQSRAGKGLITIKVNDRNGPVVALRVVSAEDQVMVVTTRGKVIRTRVEGISELGRNTMGVRIMRMREAEEVATFERIVDKDDEGSESEEAIVGDTALAEGDDAPDDTQDDTQDADGSTTES